MSTPILEIFAKLGLDSSEYKKGLDNAKSDASGFALSFSKAFKTAAKVGAAAFTAATTAVSIFGKKAYDSYATYEQLWGGVQKLYGEGAEALKQYAEEAYKTAGMSTNEYMETATTFSASLMKALGNNGKEAARITDIAMRAMSDNVNTFGTDIEAVANAFKGLSRQNYTMIDNLKLGYAGTAAGMLELINDSGILGKTLTDTSELATVGFDKMILAIQKIQENQHIAETTAREAMTTIEGSANATRKAWENVVLAVGKGEGIGTAISNLGAAIFGEKEGEGFLTQMTERVKTVMASIGEMIVEFAPEIINNIPRLFEALVPPVLSSTITLFTAAFDLLKEKVPEWINLGIEYIKGFSGGLVKGIPDLLNNVLPIILSLSERFRAFMGKVVDIGLELLKNLVKGLMDGLPALISFVPEIVSNIANVINDNMPKIFATAWEIIKTIISGIIAAIPSLVENSGKIVEAIWNVITAINWISLGEKVLTGIIKGIKNLVSSLAKSVKELAQKAWDSFKDSVNWSELGKNLIDGIKSGIKNAAKGLAESVVNAAKSALNSVKKFLGINSPSKLMRDEVGKYMALGLGQGFEDFIPVDDMVDSVKDAVDDIATAGISGMENDFASAGGVDTSEETTVSSFGEIVINIYGQDKSLKEIADEVSDVLERQIGALRRAYR